MENENSGCLELSEQAWEKILRFYMYTYRGPNAEQNLRHQLDGYSVLTMSGHVGKGNYIRYMGKGLVGNNLHRGGWVVKCNKKTIQLEDGRRKWRINRQEKYIFVRNSSNTVRNKSKMRVWMEELLRKNTVPQQRFAKIQFHE